MKAFKAFIKPSEAPQGSVTMQVMESIFIENGRMYASLLWITTPRVFSNKNMRKDPGLHGV